MRDLVSALVLLSEKGIAGEAYNISGEKVYSMQLVIEIIEQVCDRKFILDSDSTLFRPTDEPIIYGDSTKLKTETRWIQKYSLQETVIDMFKYLNQRR